MKLSIFCHTLGEPYARLPLQLMSNLARVLGAELVVAADTNEIKSIVKDWGVTRNIVPSELAVEQCQGDWVLELHDNEAASIAMVRWLWSSQYQLFPNWKFPRVHLWPDNKSVLMAPGMFPDWQFRLTSRESGPTGLAPVVIECHDLLDGDPPVSGLMLAKGDGSVPWTPDWIRPVGGQ